MTLDLAKIVDHCLRPLVDKYGLRQQNEINNGQTYAIDYASKYFVVRLEKYRTEFYATLYKPGNTDDQIDLFNLLAYLASPRPDAPNYEYFCDEANIEERYRKQLTHVASVLDHYYDVIGEFFGTDNYSSNVAKVREFMVKKYPELFKRRQYDE